MNFSLRELEVLSALVGSEHIYDDGLNQDGVRTWYNNDDLESISSEISLMISEIRKVRS